MAVLILDAHSRAGLEALQSFGRARIPVDIAHGSSVESATLRSRYARNRFEQPSSDPADAFLAWARALDRQHSYRLIVPATEASLLCLKRLPQDDALRRKSVLPAEWAIDIALDKQKTWELAQGLHLRVAPSQLISDERAAAALSAADFPQVLKPVNGNAPSAANERLTAAVVRTPQERAAILKKWLPITPVQQQQFIHGHGMGIECLYVHGRMAWHFCHERLHEHPLTGGGSSYRRSRRPPPNLLAAAKALLDKLEWHGVAMVEFRLDARTLQPVLMEINPRLWGSIALAIDAGVDFPLGLWRIATSQDPGPQPAYRSPYYTRLLNHDVEWLKENWRADHNDPLLLTRPRLRSIAEYLRPLMLSESWDHWDLHDLGPTVYALRQTNRRVWGPITRKVRNRLAERSIRQNHRRLIASYDRRPTRIERLLFVCYGNICRSPFALQYARQKLPSLTIDSAGFHSREHRSTPAHVQQAAQRLGVNLTAWQSQRLTRERLDSATLTLFMDLQNFEHLRTVFPDNLAHATALGLFLPAPTISINDPYAMDDAATTEVLKTIRAAIDALAEWIDAVNRLAMAHGSAAQTAERIRS